MYYPVLETRKDSTDPDRKEMKTRADEGYDADQFEPGAVSFDKSYYSYKGAFLDDEQKVMAFLRPAVSQSSKVFRGTIQSAPRPR